jgi:hypothetical protein
MRFGHTSTGVNAVYSLISLKSEIDKPTFQTNMFIFISNFYCICLKIIIPHIWSVKKLAFKLDVQQDTLNVN